MSDYTLRLIAAEQRRYENMAARGMGAFFRSRVTACQIREAAAAFREVQS